MTSTEPVTCVARDQISAAIEKHLRALEAHGWCELKVSEAADGFQLRFGESTVAAETYDIALVRLANLLLNNSELSGTLMATLRGVVPRHAESF